VSETPKKLNVDVALREWPDAGKPAAEWDEMARRIDDRVRSGEPARSISYVSDENLLAAPLGQSSEEGHNSAAPAGSAGAHPGGLSPKAGNIEAKPMTMQDRERDRRSLQDLAKMAQGGSFTPPPPSVRPPLSPTSSAPSGVQRAVEAKADDSGVVDLALAAQSDPGAAARAKSTPLAQDGLFDDEPASIRPGPVSGSPVSAGALQQPTPTIPPFSAPPSIPASAASVAPAPASVAPISAAPVSAAAIAAPTPITSAPEKKKGGKGIVFALTGVIALGAVAAGGFFVMKSIQAKHAAEAALAAAAAQPATPPPVVAAAPDTKPADPTPAPEATTDPNALPTAEPANAKLAAKAPTSAAGKPQALALNTPAPAPAKAEGPAKISEKDIPTTPTGPAGDLGNAMRGAVGADGKPTTPTPASDNTGPQFAAGTVPQRPSQGAVTGALGAVLPGARTCLGPDDPISRATITFASAGNVTGVNVSGGAAGKPAEACIKSALQKAKIAPFMESSYTANVTIRHN